MSEIKITMAKKVEFNQLNHEMKHMANIHSIVSAQTRGSVTQWLACQTCNSKLVDFLSVVSTIHIKATFDSLSKICYLYC